MTYPTQSWTTTKEAYLVELDIIFLINIWNVFVRFGHTVYTFTLINNLHFYINFFRKFTVFFRHLTGQFKNKLDTYTSFVPLCAIKIVILTIIYHNLRNIIFKIYKTSYKIKVILSRKFTRPLLNIAWVLDNSSK